MPEKNPDELGCQSCGGPIRRNAKHSNARFCSQRCVNLGRRRPTLAERFHARVDRRGGPEECWPWVGAVNRGGYGRMLWTDGHQHGAHRIAFELAFGWTLAHAVVCHSCDNPRCCNPTHLWLGTVADNNKDRAAKGRSCRGMRHHSARLSDADVIAIRAAKGVTLSALAGKYGVSISTVHGIRTGRKRSGVAA